MAAVKRALACRIVKLQSYPDRELRCRIFSIGEGGILSLLITAFLAFRPRGSAFGLVSQRVWGFRRSTRLTDQEDIDLPHLFGA